MLRSVEFSHVFEALRFCWVKNLTLARCNEQRQGTLIESVVQGTKKKISHYCLRLHRQSKRYV